MENDKKKDNNNKNWKKIRHLRKRKAWFRYAAPKSDTFKKAKDVDDILYNEIILKWFNNVAFSLKTNYVYSVVLTKEESNRIFHEFTKKCIIALGVDVGLEDKVLIRFLVSCAHMFPQLFVKNIYSNAVEFQMIFDEKMDKVPIQRTFVVSFSLIDVLGDKLVKSKTGECFRTYLSKCTFRWSKKFVPCNFKPIYQMYKCPCCHFYVMDKGLKRNHASWVKLYEHVQSRITHTDIQVDYNLTTFHMDHDVLMKFYEKVEPIFTAGVKVLKPYYKIQHEHNLLDGETIKKVEQKVLTMKYNVVQQYPIPIQCAAIYKYGATVCSDVFEKYIAFIHGVCVKMVNNEIFRSFKSELRPHLKELINKYLSQSLASLHTGGMGQQYNAIPGEASLDKDVKYYFILHSEIIGHE